MSKSRTSVLWSLALLLLLVFLVSTFVPEVSATTINDPAIIENETEDGGSEDGEVVETPDSGENTVPPESGEDGNPPEADENEDPEVDSEDVPPVKQGLWVEDGNTYYYNEDGTLFTGGLKEVTVDGITERYFF